MAVSLNPCNITIRLRHAGRITGWDIRCSEHGYLKTVRTKADAFKAAKYHYELEVTTPGENM